MTRRVILSLIAVGSLIGLGAASPSFGQDTLNTLATFNGTNGALPKGGLIADAAGNLYGTTVGGGANEKGTVFELATGTNVPSTLVTFDGDNGANPESGLMADIAGNLYGTTFGGGSGGNGTVFKVAAGTNAFSTLATFDLTNGGAPHGGLVADASGNLYGATEEGGNGGGILIGGGGTVFEVAAGTHALSTVVNFDGANGEAPRASLIADSAGNLYGTTHSGGPLNDGSVYELAAGTHTPSTVAWFNPNNGGGTLPVGGVLIDGAGNLFGTTLSGGAGHGTVFEVPAGTNAISYLATFNGTNGSAPEAGLIADAAGNLYGTTAGGGVNNDGTVFQVAAGTNIVTTLATFTGDNGSAPWAGLHADASGNLYGTTSSGGSHGDGTVYQILPAANSWSNAADGTWSNAPNWSTISEPTSLTSANFNTGSATPYTVTLNSPAVATALNVQGDNVTIQKAGNNLTIGFGINLSQGAKLTLAGAGGTTVGSVNIANSQLDITDNAVVINYGVGNRSPVGSIGNFIAGGFNGGAWNGVGIVSSKVASVNAAHGNPHLYGVGYADASDPAVAAHHFTPGTAVIEPAIVGDANLDGVVNYTDFLLLAASFNQHGTSWDQGNFNYGPTTNFGDFLLLAGNFNDSTSLDNAQLNAMNDFAKSFGDTLVPNSDGNGFTVVPEPASIGILGAITAGLLARRRRKCAFGREIG